MLENLGVALKLGTKKITNCSKISLFHSVYLGGVGQGWDMTRWRQHDTGQHGHNTQLFKLKCLFKGKSYA